MSATSPTRLPPPRTKVRIPRLLPPSLIAIGEECPVRMFVGAPDESGTLAPSTVALLGTVLHHVRALWRIRPQDAADDGKQAAEEIDAMLADTLAESDAQLESDTRTSGLAPLSEAVGYDRYVRQRMMLQRWAMSGVERVVAMEPGRLHLRLFDNERGAVRESEDRFDTGIEPLLVANELRLRGRPDLLVRSADGTMVISDDKTGRVVDDTGHVLDKHEMQLWLYALMVEHSKPGIPVNLRVIGESTHVVAWDQDTRERAMARLTEAHERFPPDTVVAMDQFAVPGSSCPNCRLRPRCASYQQAATAWWSRSGAAPRPVPFDAWGRLEQFEETDLGLELRLEDDARRVVRIRGLSEAHGLTASHLNHRVHLFGLQPTQELRLHGRWLAPTSWHERPPSRAYVRARTTRVFLG